MRLALTLIALLAATPASADPACLAAPTQDCVFQMAVDQAVSQPKIEDVIQGLVEIALWQETAGRDDWAATLAHLPPILRARPNLDPFDLAGTVSIVTLSNANADAPYLSETTQTAAQLGHVLTEFAPAQDGPEASDLFRLGRMGNLEAIYSHLSAASPTSAEKIAGAAAAGLVNAGRIEDAFGLLRVIPSPALSGKISRMATLHVLTTSGPTEAQALALRFANQGDRIDALFAVAHHWASTGHPDKALAIARTLPPKVWLSENRSDNWYLAEILAANGASSLLFRPTNPNRPPSLGPIRALRQVQFVAAALSADAPVALVALGGFPSSLRYGYAEAALQARWIVDGQAGAEEILALMAPEDMPQALAVLGLAQIKTGDLAAALATEARISALSRQHPALKALRRDLAPLLASQGQAAKAVAMAAKLGDAKATAHVAAVLPPGTTD